MTRARAAFQEVSLYRDVTTAVGPDHAEVVTLLLLASVDLLVPERRTQLTALTGRLAEDSPLTAELSNVRAQLAALWEHSREVA